MIVCLVMFFSMRQVFAGGNILQQDPSDDTQYYPVKWTASQFPIVWRLSSDGAPGSGIDIVQLNAEIEQAFNTWGGDSLADVSFINGGLVNEKTVGIDGINLITFTDQDYLFPSEVAAFAVNFTFPEETTITDIYNDIDGDGNRDLPNGVYPPGTIFEADIVFNTAYNFDVSGSYGTVDVRSVALHEIGHVLGLTHSIIEDSVMYPFLAQDISAARTLSNDDLSYVEFLYPIPNRFRSTISGNVINGYTSEPIVGAHVFITYPGDSKKIVGAYTALDGSFVIPVNETSTLDYYIGIEPLDGAPPANDPARINESIKDTFDTDFITEFYDVNESNIETSPLNAKIVNAFTVVTGDPIPPSGITFITNTSQPPGVGMTLNAGLNLFSYPVQTLDGFTAFDLLQALGDATEINSIDQYNATTGRYERVYWKNNTPAGVNFSINRGEAYLVHMQVTKNIIFNGPQNCPTVKTKAGFNLIGIPCPPPGYSAFDLLKSLGGSAVYVKRYNADTATFSTAMAVINGDPTGDDFSVDNGVGYIVEMLAAQGEVTLDGGNQNFPAFISGVSPGRGITGSRVSISGMGFSELKAANEVLFNGARAAVNTASVNSLAVTVPNTATTGPVTVGSAGALSNAVNFIVEPRITTEADVTGKDIIDGQTIQGDLSTNIEQDRYSFVASKDTYVTATAISINPSVPDLLLFLEGPSGEILASDNNSAGGSNPKISRFKLSRSGRYTIVVTSVPDTGIGQYTFSLNLENIPPVKDINILSGDAQNGLMGSTLKEPLELYVTGPDGHAMTGVPVTLTTDNDSLVVSNAFTAATFQYITNASGIVMVDITLPNVAGEYKIDINIPGYPVKTLTASSLPSLPASVQVSGNNQTCNAMGCTVGQVVDNPYQLKFLDSSGLPVSGVITKFDVVSGGGQLVEGVGANKQSVKLTSDANGIVQASHLLGNLVADINGNKIPQIVAATSNIASAEVILFTPVVAAAAPSKMVSLKSGAMRMTMGTAKVNAINIQIQDIYGNPVPDAPITYTPPGGLQLVPGSVNGKTLPGMATNSDGVFMGTFIANFNSSPVNFYDGINQTLAGSINMGTSGVTPTIDEFGARITQPYNIVLSTNGVASPLNINVDVDMGPSLVIVTQSGGLNVNDKQWVGKDFVNPIKMKMISYQRTDRCSNLIDTGSGITDSDQGDWRDEPFTIDGIRSWSYFSVDTTYTVARNDSIDDPTMLLTPTINAQPPANSIKVSTDISYANRTAFLSSEIEPVNVNSGNASGKITVTAVTDPYTRNFEADTVCLFNSGDSAFNTIQYPDGVSIGIQQPLLSTGIVPPLSNFLPLTVSSPTLTISILDDIIAEPALDPYPGLRSATGVDLTSVQVTLNGAVIFNGATNTTALNSYPNFIELKSDNAPITSLQNQILNLLAPMNFEITYQPTASELNLTGTNTVVVTQAKDKVGNALPAPVTYGFTAP